MYSEESKMLEIKARADKGESAAKAAEDIGVRPQTYYSWKARTKAKGGLKRSYSKAKVIFHDTTEPLTGTVGKTIDFAPRTTTPTGYAIFGTAEFIKTFVEQMS